MGRESKNLRKLSKAEKVYDNKIYVFDISFYTHTHTHTHTHIHTHTHTHTHIHAN